MRNKIKTLRVLDRIIGEWPEGRDFDDVEYVSIQEAERWISGDWSNITDDELVGRTERLQANLAYTRRINAIALQLTIIHGFEPDDPRERRVLRRALAVAVEACAVRRRKYERLARRLHKLTK
ncbi:MAG: hypothetical protein ACO3GM_04165 [Candidatus Limnocylindrus sp.]